MLAKDARTSQSTPSGMVASLALNGLARGEYTAYVTSHDTDKVDVVSVRHALLALLSEGPKYGLQLREEFEARTGEVWPLNVGQVYTTLQRLERDGLVESEGTEQGPQNVFQITETGTTELATWLRTPPDLSAPPRDELVMKVLMAIRLPGTDVGEVIQTHRRYLVQLMQEWTRIKEGGAESDLSLALAVDAELFRLDSVVRWLDSVDSRIRRAAAEGHVEPALAPMPKQRRHVGARP
jgi:DNA-binding PadR family transcriptional regulator